MYRIILALLAVFTATIHANVEKTIFIAPPSTTIPSAQPDLDDLGLERLSPENAVVRARLNASFPTPESPDGSDSWFFLENLNPGQRYEVRVCWLATVCSSSLSQAPNQRPNPHQQPTTFTLATYPLTRTIEDAALLSSISIFSSARLAAPETSLPPDTIPRSTRARNSVKTAQDPAPTTDSVLFLRIRAAADYYSADKALMRDVPPVVVDVILDPFLWNVFPRSLIPTAGWIAVVAVVAVVVARWVAGEIGRVIIDARRAREVPVDKKER